MPETLAGLVKTYRSSAGMSQELLAERSGLSVRTIGDIETGFQRSPRLITIVLIAQALQLNEEDRACLQGALPKRGAKDDGTSPPAKASLPHIPLFGRDREIADITAKLNGGGARLLTLTGPAGVGKTSLCACAAARCAERFDSVTMVPLAPISDPKLVPSALATELGLREQSEAPLPAAIAAELGNGRRLLVLDNFEQVLPAAAWLGELLTQCPALTALVTSRERLHLRMEHAYAIRPLENSAGVDLFVERARAVNFDFALTSANEPVIKSIVQRLEGLPLAIELAAPRLVLLTPQALLARLERRLPLLESGPVDLPQRQQTMRNAIEWSYDLLSAHEQRLFRAMGVFSGGATIEAASAVYAEREENILSILAALVEKSLLSLSEDDEGEPRIAMLELLREFALERIKQAGEAAQAQARMASHFLEFAVHAEAALKGANQVHWLARVEREYANIRAVLDWSVHGGHLETGMRLAGTMARFWWMRGYFSEGRSWCDRLLDGMNSSVQAVSSFGEAKVLQANVLLMNAMGDFQEAMAPCERAVALWREIGDDGELSISLNSLGIMLQMLGRYDEARGTHEEALSIRRRIGDRYGIATSLGSLASVAHAGNDTAAAITAVEESIDIFRSLENASALSISLTKLGRLLHETRNYERANQMFEESLALQMLIDDKANMAYSYDRLAVVASDLGRYDVARERWRQAFELLEAAANKSLIAEALEGLMVLAIRQGDYRQAAHMCGAAEALREAISAPMWPHQVADYGSRVREIRDELGDAAFAQERRLGACAPLRQILNETFAVTV